MYCSKCGKKVEETSVFCDGCGNLLKESETKQAKVDKREKYFMDEQLKAFLGIIMYVVLVLAFWFFSRANMFDFAFGELTLPQFLDKLIYISNMSQELEGFKGVCQVLLWVFRIGLFAYLFVLIFVFMNKRKTVRIITIAGFICNAVVVMAILIGLFLCVEELAGLFYVGVDDVFGFIKQCLKESFYLYGILNVMLLVCSLMAFETDENIEVKLSEKDKILLEMAEEHRAKENGWNCKKCGEKNESFTMICRGCGTSKE